MLELIEAIETKRIISFTYKGKKRKAEVYALGVGQSSDLICRCYEIPVGGFKLFFVEQMENVKLEERRWYIPRSGYNRYSDRSMVEVLKQI